MTILSAYCIDRFEKNGPQILKDSQFSMDNQHWKVQVSPGCRISIANKTVSLVSISDGKTAEIWQTVINDQNYRLVKLEALIRCNNVVPGIKPWNRARLILGQHDGKEFQWNLSHTVVALEGTKEWEIYHTIFPISSETKSFRINAQLSQCSGLMEIANISLYSVRQNRLYGLAQKAVVTAWGIYLFFLIISIVSKDRSIYGKLSFMISILAILTGATVPGTIKTEVTKAIQEQITGMPLMLNSNEVASEAVPDQDYQLSISKRGHFFLFFLLGFALSVVLRFSIWYQVFLYLILFAGSTEFIQFYIDDRNPLFSDFILDCSGGTVGILVFNSALKLKRHAIEHNEY